MAHSVGCARCARIVPWFSFWGNLVLAVYKLAVGILGASAALVVDALHSFTDVVGSAGIVVATNASARRPDQRYPYGRGKAEFVGAVFVYTILVCLATVIIAGAVRELLKQGTSRPHLVTALGAGISIAHNCLMYKYEICVGKRLKSPAILADAFENRADAISSVAAVIGIIGSLLIHPALDRIAALIVGVIIFWSCAVHLAHSSKGLLDRAVPVEEQDRLKALVLGVPRVTGVRFLRTRQTGVRYWIDVGLDLPHELPMDQADSIVAAVRERLKQHPECHYVDVYLFPAAEQPGARGLSNLQEAPSA